MKVMMDEISHDGRHMSRWKRRVKMKATYQVEVRIRLSPWHVGQGKMDQKSSGSGEVEVESWGIGELGGEEEEEEPGRRRRSIYMPQGKAKRSALS
jgi:hypothetical protein